MARPSKLTYAQWADVRTRREVFGTSYLELGKMFGISHMAINRKAIDEGWANVEEARKVVSAKAKQKVTGIVKELTAAQRDEAIEEESSRLAAVQLRQRVDWTEAKAIADAAMIRHQQADIYRPEDLGRNLDLEEIQANAANRRAAAEDVKTAKVHAETIRIIQDGERKAWDMDAPIDLSKLTDEELEAELRR